MSKLLNIPKSKIKGELHLFSGIDPEMKICFYKLYKLEKEHYASAFMLLEYLLAFSQRAMEIIEEWVFIVNPALVGVCKHKCWK